MSEWQPIETAPAGEPLLLYQKPRELFKGHWIPDEPRMIVGCVGGNYGPSTCNIVGFECETEVDKPTHWMPLPEPPK